MSQGIELEKGRISVNTQNILPIIKKWLYSEKEIFVRPHKKLSRLHLIRN